MPQPTEYKSVQARIPKYAGDEKTFFPQGRKP